MLSPTPSLASRPTTAGTATATLPATTSGEADTGEAGPGEVGPGEVGPGEVGIVLDRFGVVPWLDPTETGTGHDPRSAYVETFWLPVVGPSTTLLLRRLADEFDASPDGFEIDCASLSREIGLGLRMDKRGSFARTLDRCIKFNMLQADGELLYARRRIPTLGHRQINKLSARLQTLHHSWTIDPADDGAARRTELVRAAHLARTLLALGEDTHEAEKQLHKWQFHPSIAWHAVQWALTGPEQIP